MLLSNCTHNIYPNVPLNYYLLIIFELTRQQDSLPSYRLAAVNEKQLKTFSEIDELKKEDSRWASHKAARLEARQNALLIARRKVLDQYAARLPNPPWSSLLSLSMPVCSIQQNCFECYGKDENRED
jgi:hypothetical protein